MTKIVSSRMVTKAALKTWWKTQSLRAFQNFFLLPCLLLSSPCFITLNLLWICNLDLYGKDCFFQNGYQSRTRNLVEDAKFESRVNEENKRNWIQSIRHQSEGKHSWNPQNYLRAPYTQSVYSQNFLTTLKTNLGPHQIATSWGQCYKTYYGRKLRLFIIS
jgi:hypothetical protein